MKQSSVVSRQSSVIKHKIRKKLFFILFFLFATIHFSLFSAYAYAYEFHSRATVVMESSTGRILYAKNPNLRLPPASTTKLMTAIVVMEGVSPSDVVKISKNVSLVTPLKAGFKEGDEVTIETLLYAAL